MCFGANWKPRATRVPSRLPSTAGCKTTARPRAAWLPEGWTNLIDFTRDYLVALFFACYDRKGEEDGGGWTGGDGRIVFLPEADTTIVDAPIGDNRALAQRSVFCWERCGILPEDAYECLCVPRCLKRQLLMYLARCHGIRTDTMFPDFAGAVRQVSSHASLDALWDEVSIANRPCRRYVHARPGRVDRRLQPAGTAPRWRHPAPINAFPRPRGGPTGSQWRFPRCPRRGAGLRARTIGSIRG